MKNIPLIIKLKAAFFGNIKYLNKNIQIPLWIRIILHFFNYIFIFGGWIFVASYFDDYLNLKGSESAIASLISIILINLLILFLSPVKIKESNRKHEEDSEDKRVK